MPKIRHLAIKTKNPARLAEFYAQVFDMKVLHSEKGGAVYMSDGYLTLAILRNRGLEGAKFRRQVPVGRYFADFACLEAKLIVELDGGQHDAQADYDARRTEALEAAGWRVIRFWNNEVVETLDGVARTIATELALARSRS